MGQGSLFVYISSRNMTFRVFRGMSCSVPPVSSDAQDSKPTKEGSNGTNRGALPNYNEDSAWFWSSMDKTVYKLAQHWRVWRFQSPTTTTFWQNGGVKWSVPRIKISTVKKTATAVLAPTKIAFSWMLAHPASSKSPCNCTYLVYSKPIKEPGLWGSTLVIPLFRQWSTRVFPSKTWI